MPLLRQLFVTVKSKSALYWLFAVVAIFVGIFLGDWFGSHGVWVDLRNRAYQALQGLAPHQPQPKETVLILIGDEEYWKGRRLSHRVPTHRDYLADLVKAVDACNPSVIALDFDMRSPVTDGSIIDSPEYGDETKELLKVITFVAHRRAVVMAATVNINRKGEYISESTVYNTLPPGTVRRGYIQIPSDVRQVPTALHLAGEMKLDSFSEAIVRARHEPLLKDLEDSSSLPFGTFMGEAQFPHLFAPELLDSKGGDVCKKVEHNIAIIGAAWHRDAYHRGPWSDEHQSPVGPMRGVFLHANYVEAMLDARTYRPLGERYGKVLEFLFSAVVALILALEMAYRKKLQWVAAICAGLMVVSYVFWQNLGIFFDFFFPVIFLVLHALADYVVELQEYRSDALAFRAMGEKVISQ